MTLTNTPSGTVHPPLLPVRRPPALEPPCDGDDLIEISAMVATELPFDWSDPPATHPGFAEARADAARDESERGAALDAAERYVRVCLETLNGFRPASHLRALSGTAPLADAVSQLARRRNNGPMIRRMDRLPPALPSSRRPMRFGPPVPPTGTDSRFDTTASIAVPRGAAGSGPPGGAVSSRGTPGIPPGPRVPGGVPGTHPGARVPGSTVPGSTVPGNTVPGSTVPGNSGRFSAPGIGRAPRPASPIPPPFRLKRLRHSSPRPGVAEIVAILGHAETTVACAIRMELTGTTWRPTLIQVV